MRSSVSEIKIGWTCCEACTGPFQPKVTVRQFQSGTPGPVWMRALVSYMRLLFAGTFALRFAEMPQEPRSDWVSPISCS